MRRSMMLFVVGAICLGLALGGRSVDADLVAQPETIVDYTSNPEELVAGIEKMGTRPAQPGNSQLMEAIAEHLETLAQPGRRPVMVVMRMGGSASSSMRQEVVRETQRKTGTLLFAISPANTTGGGGGAVSYGGGNAGQARTDYAASESVYRSRNLEAETTVRYRLPSRVIASPAPRRRRSRPYRDEPAPASRLQLGQEVMCVTFASSC